MSVEDQVIAILTDENNRRMFKGKYFYGNITIWLSSASEIELTWFFFAVHKNLEYEIIVKYVKMFQMLLKPVHTPKILTKHVCSNYKI